ncbi:MAG: gliding motility lipoprotein GldD [Bacteroidales bacterium]
MKKVNFFRTICYGVLSFLCVACQENYTPKPMGYMRIALPKKEYRTFDSLPYPFTFEYPVYAHFTPVNGIQWSDINIDGLNAKIYLSYVKNPNLDSCIAQTLSFITPHMAKASGIREKEINDSNHKKYGYVYDIKGKEVASTYQFYLTDSNKHFIRGALYLNCRPNNDSLAPIIDFLKKDLDKMLESWVWKSW